jgi:hypothetical protein
MTADCVLKTHCERKSNLYKDRAIVVRKS